MNVLRAQGNQDERSPALPTALEGRSLSLPAALFAMAALLGIAALALPLPVALLRAAAVVLLFGGLAFPLVARLAPRGAAPLKLLLYSVALSPLLAAALDCLLSPWLRRSWSLCAVFGLGLVLQPLALRCRARRAPLGRAGSLACLLALLAMLIVALLLFCGNAPRISFHGLLHSSILLACERSLPPENPWFAGEPLAYYWFWHALGGLCARALALAPTEALAVLNVWSAGVSVLALWMFAALVWSDARRSFTAALVGFLGLNALGGWCWLARGAALPAPTNNLELLAALRALVPGEAAAPWFDPRLANAFSKFGNLSSYPSALALQLCALLAAAHALRQGRLVWLVLTAAAQAGALALNPVVGGLGGLVLGLAACCCSPSAQLRWRLLFALLVAALPGACLVLLASRGYSETLLSWNLSSASLAGALWPLSLLLWPAWRAWRQLASEATPERKSLRGLLGLAVVVPLVLAVLLALPEGNQYKLVRLSAIGLGLLAGAALFDARLPRLERGLCAVLLLGGLAANTLLGLWCYAKLAAQDLPLLERPLQLIPLAPTPDGRVDPRAPLAALSAQAQSEAYQWLARLSRGLCAAGTPLAEQPLLLWNPLLLGAAYGGTSSAPQARFSEDYNLQGHEAPAFAGLSLWCDRKSYLVEALPTWEERLSGVAQLYRDKVEWHELHRNTLFGLGRPVLLAVTSEDRELNPFLPNKVQLYGFAPLASFGSAQARVDLYCAPAQSAAQLEGLEMRGAAAQQVR